MGSLIYYGRMRESSKHKKKLLYVWRIGDYLIGKLYRTSKQKIDGVWKKIPLNGAYWHWYIKHIHDDDFKYLTPSTDKWGFYSRYVPWMDDKYKDQEWYLGDSDMRDYYG